MPELKFKEFSNGKLYLSDEASKTEILIVNDLNRNPFEIKLNEAISMSIFPKRFETNLKNQIAFLEKCKLAGILPEIQIYILSAKQPDINAQNILFITSSYQQQLKYYQMFYLPEAETIFNNLFHSQNWSLINAESSESNVAQKGYGISSLDSFEKLIRMIRNGDYIITSQNINEMGALVDTANIKPASKMAESLKMNSDSDEAKLEASVKSIDVVNEKPVVTPVEIKKANLIFKLESFEIKQSYIYGFSDDQKELVPSQNYSVAIAGVKIRNSSTLYQRFSSPQFSIVGKSGKKMEALFYGEGDTIAEKDKILKTESKINGPDEQRICKIKGILSENASYLEWELSPKKEYDGNLIFLIRDDNKDLNLQFAPCGIYEFVEKSPFHLNFIDVKSSQSYSWESNSKIHEISASSDYTFLVSKIKMVNDSSFPIRVSSAHFSVLDGNNEEVDAKFYGTGINIVQNNQVTSFESVVNKPDGNKIQTITGRLTTSFSFIEWELQPNQNLDEILLFLIPKNSQNAHVDFNILQGNGEYFHSTSQKKNNTSGLKIEFVVNPQGATVVSETNPKTDERPIIITIICVLGLIVAISGLILIKSDNAKQIGTWFPAYIGVSSVIEFVSMIGLWVMKKWAVYLYLGFMVFNQILIIWLGLWNVYSVIFPVIVLSIAFSYIKKMN